MKNSVKINNNSITMKCGNHYYKIKLRDSIREDLKNAIKSHSNNKRFKHENVFNEMYAVKAVTVFRCINERKEEITETQQRDFSRLSIINNSDGITFIIDINGRNSEMPKIDIGIASIPRETLLKNNVKYLLELGY